MNDKSNDAGILSGIPWYKRMEVLRARRGWTQKETAEKCGTSRRTYWNWENGKNKPMIFNKRKIAKLFNVSVKEIFD